MKTLNRKVMNEAARKKGLLLAVYRTRANREARREHGIW